MTITKHTKKETAIKLGKECKKCGKCCSYGAGYSEKKELKKIAEFLNITEEELINKYFDEVNVFNKLMYRPKLLKKHIMPFGACIFLKDNTCIIQEVKPLHCRVGNCNEHGEALSEWYTINYLVDEKNHQSIREWNLRVMLKPTIKGGNPKDIIKDKEKLKKILGYDLR